MEMDTSILDWLRGQQTMLWWLGALSVVTFFGTLIALPLVVASIPADYFRRDHRYASRQPTPLGVLHLLSLLLRNVLGLVFVIAGIAMLVLPGQGILTIVIGLMLMRFPGKQALERRFILQPSVLRAINWMRAKAHRPPLEVPATETTTAQQLDK
jgi:hypothetical protein